MMRSANVYKVARAGSMNHRCLFPAMGMRYRAQIGYLWNMGHEIENDEVIKPHRGDRGQVRGTQTPASFGGMSHLCNWCATHLLNCLLSKKKQGLSSV